MFVGHHQQAHITKTRHEPSYKQLEVNTNRTYFCAIFPLHFHQQLCQFLNFSYICVYSFSLQILQKQDKNVIKGLGKIHYVEQSQLDLPKTGK